jgi:DNA invertase Pin-like site-specific DNA recombinase
MHSEVDYGPFLKALSGADPIQARRFAAAKALETGWGSVSKVSAITGFSRTTINKGIQELESNEELGYQKGSENQVAVENELRIESQTY